MPDPNPVTLQRESPLASEEYRRKAKRVWDRHRGATDRLLSARRPFHVTNRQSQLFLRAMQEAFAHHYLGSPELQRLSHHFQFFPWDLRKSGQISRVPYFFVGALKYHQVRSVPEEQIALTLRSSGTGGQTSAIYLDRSTLARIKKVVKNIYQDFSMADHVKTNYLCFTYDPEVAKDVGTAFSDKLLTDLTRVNHVTYAIAWDEETQDWKLDTARVRQALERYNESRRPFRLLGFPAHTWRVLREILEERQGTPFRFGPRSFVITGGGWKNFDHQEISKPEFRETVSRILGIPRHNVRDLYGMVEHGIPYCECENFSMHVPNYSQVFVRSPQTMELLPQGAEGLLQFVTPYHHSFPAISLLTSDKGVVRTGCRCGRNSPYIQLRGRAGIKKHKGCAISALQVASS